jgi:hypothetical protein
VTRRILGPAGRRRRAYLVVGLLVLLPLILVGPAGALDTNSPPAGFGNASFYTPDEQLADDQPGQKDLSAHAVATPSPGDLWVAWKWDVTSLSGNNTGDGCALFDTDDSGSGIGKVDFAICVTIGGDPAVQLTSVGSPRVYTCGDGKADRCTSTATQVSPIGSACSINQSGIDRSDPYHSGQLDTVALCHVALSDVGGATVARHLNTCSYPSQQPNSDPSDCVLIPRDAFLTVNKACTVSGDPGKFDLKIDATVAGDDVSCGGSTGVVALRAGTYTVSEVAGAGTSLSDYETPSIGGDCSSAGSVTLGSDQSKTCTITNTLKANPVVTINKSCPNGPAASTDRFQPKDGSANAGSAIACGGSTTYNPSPGVAYSITEAAGSTTPVTDLNNYTTTYSATGCSGTLARGATATCTIINTLKADPAVTINKLCPSGAQASTDRFQPKDGSANAGSAIACDGSTTYNPSPGVAYSITEAAGSTTPATNLSNYTTTYSATGCSGTLARGQTATCTITNTLKTYTVITLVCEGSALKASSVKFDNVTMTSLGTSSDPTPAALCALTGARFTGKKSGTYDTNNSVTITP